MTRPVAAIYSLRIKHIDVHAIGKIDPRTTQGSAGEVIASSRPRPRQPRRPPVTHEVAAGKNSGAYQMIGRDILWRQA
jgi:hypothetical protein